MAMAETKVRTVFRNKWTKAKLIVDTKEAAERVAKAMPICWTRES